MKKYKNLLFVILSIGIYNLLLGQSIILADNNVLQLGAYNLSGERECVVNVEISELIIVDENVGYLIEEKKIDKKIDVTEKISLLAEENDNFIYMDIRTDNDENQYPEIEPTSAMVTLPKATGNVRKLIGKDYRLYYADNSDSEFEDVSEKITDASLSNPQFTLDKLGIYILYFNPKVYTVTFYLEEPIYNDGNWENQNCIYEEIEDLEYTDTIEFPEIPQKNGYIFTGWRARHFSGGSGGGDIKYTTAQPIKVSAHREFYASWCPEEEYTPLEISIESDKTIRKGKEDGSAVLLTLSEGKFAEIIDEDVESQWRIVGSDEITIGSVERIDDTTAKLTLSGNSSNKYTTGEIQIEFNSSLYVSSEEFGDNFEIHEIADIQLDEKGIKKEMFISDNSIELKKQSKSSGGSSTTRFTVQFNANGGGDIPSQRIERNGFVAEIEEPAREGYIFKGWYKDEELTQVYDFTEKVTKGFTLYAMWEEDNLNKIILTIGEKEAVVFGKVVTNDVAPMIKNDRAYLPVRFVAESLGTEVIWDKEKPELVTIKKENVTIEILIGEKEAVVNGEKVEMDSSAFLNNDRTYLPIRFVAESLGCSVKWIDGEKEITITK